MKLLNYVLIKGAVLQISPYRFDLTKPWRSVRRNIHSSANDIDVICMTWFQEFETCFVSV